MTRECHVRFCERLRGNFLRPTYHFGIKAHIGVDADSGLVRTVVGTATNVNDVTQANAPVHGEETDVFANSGDQGVTKREETQHIEANWHVAMRPGKRRALDTDSPVGTVMDRLEHVKDRIQAKVEQPFRVIKRQFGHVKVHYLGLAKSTAQLHTLFAHRPRGRIRWKSTGGW